MRCFDYLPKCLKFFWGVNVLKIENVYKSYNKHPVLKGITMSIDDGEVRGLIGVNGAGKTTLVECICGVKSVDSGDIWIDGINIRDKKSKRKYQNIIGYMSQSFSFFNDLTVKENLEYLCAVYGVASADKVIDLCGLRSYENVIAQNLSGGYRQLLSLAGAIVHSPKFLILDEPTAAMDPLFRRKFWEIVSKCKDNGVTILVITHYMEELLECDNFTCIAGGRVSFDGNLSEFGDKTALNIEKLLSKYNFEG